MTEEKLVLKSEHHKYQITINAIDLVTKSDIPFLINKTSSDVWKWARVHFFKVYFEEYFPSN